MAKRSNQDFKVTVYYPREENKEEFENKASKVVARVLWDILSIDKVDELIELYKKNIDSSKQK